MMSFSSSEVKYWSSVQCLILSEIKSIANPSNKSCAKSGGSPDVTWENFNECKHELHFIP